MASSMVKSVSLGGAGWYTQGAGFVNHWSYPTGSPISNAALAVSSATTHITFWVSWYQMHDGANIGKALPADTATAWTQLGGNPAWRELDKQIKAANDAGRTVTLRPYHSYPAWSNKAPYPLNNQGTTRTFDEALPRDVSAGSPWAMWMAY